MARPLRIERSGAWYHVTNRGVEQRVIYADDRDRRRWLALIEEAVSMFGWIVHAYVLMDNHYHLILQLGPEANLSRGMQWLQTSYSMGFNRRHRRVGPLFQGRFGAVLVESVAWGLEVSRYVHLNPVRTARLGLNKRARQADRLGVGDKPEAQQVTERIRLLRHYRWSSYRAYVGLEPAPKWLTTTAVLDLGGRGTVRERQAAYCRYVESEIRQGLKESPWEHVQARVVLGGREFMDQVRSTLTGSAREQAQAHAMAPRPTWERVLAIVEESRGAPWAEFRDRHGDWGRDLALFLGRSACGLPLRTLGRAVGELSAAAVCVAIQRFAGRLAKEKPLRQMVESARNMLNVNA